ncbi:serin endopeptidase [Colletotrichum tofieldiae]|nr:serin endopeptidase [Colletotrichum tofieldiae]
MPQLSAILQSALVAVAAATTVAAEEVGFASGRNRLTNPASEAASGRYIVELEDSTGHIARQDSSVADSVVGQISSLGYEATVKEDFTTISGRFKGVSVEITNDNSSGVVDEIKSIPGVANAWPVQPITLDVSFEVTAGSPRWNPHIATRVSELHQRNITGAGQRVCVVDSGVDVNHPALAGKVAGGRNLVDEDSTALTDCAGHGTFVSSVISASHKDFAGVAPDSEIYMYKVFGCEDTTSNDLVLKGMLAADSDDCDIISVSIGSNTGYTNSVLSRVASEIAQDRLIVIAAGNSGEMGPYFASSPAAGRGVVSVGSVEAAQTLGWPATLVSSGGQSLNISYVTSDGTKFNETINVPINLDTGDSCNIAGFGSENAAVLAKRGVCPPFGSYSSIANAGYGYGILFDSYNQGAYYMDEVSAWSDTLRLMAVTTASALPAFDTTDGKVVAELASLAQQGAGLINAAKLFDYTTVLLSEPTLSLNDTDNRNTGSEEVTYNVSHIAASTISSRNSIWYPNTYYPPLTSAAGSLSDAKTVTVAAGATQDVQVTLSAPDVTADSGALWSGKILLAGSNDELLAVPYIGIEASTYNWTPLHHGPESYRYDETDGSLYPIDYQGKAYHPADGDSPEVYFAFRYGTYEFSVDLVGVDWETEQFTYPPQHGSGSKAWLGSVRSQPIVPGSYMDFPMREILHYIPVLCQWNRHSSGRYRIFSRALRIFGDASNPEDWQLFLSDPFSIQLGNNPIPGQNATWTSSIPTSTAAQTITTAAAPTTTSAATTTAPISVPGTTTTLSATATPTGLADAFTSLTLQRLQEDTPFVIDPAAWMELHIQISLPSPLSASGAQAGHASFDPNTRLYTITLAEWTTWHKNMVGNFFLMCRFTSDFAASMKQGTYVVQFPTVGKVHEVPIYYTAIDRSAVYERLSAAPYDDTSLYTAEVEVPASLGPWDFVRFTTSHTADSDGFICANSSVVVGNTLDAENRITSFTDVTASATEVCNVKNYRAMYNESLVDDEVLRFTVSSIQGDREAWTLNVVYLLDIQLSNGTLVLYDQRNLAFEKNPRLRTWSFNAFEGERAN